MKLWGINVSLIEDYMNYFIVSKEQLCKLADISIKELERVYNNDTSVSVEILCKLALVINVPVGKLICSLNSDFTYIELN